MFPESRCGEELWTEVVILCEGKESSSVFKERK
jgi:hypothetical protein